MTAERKPAGLDIAARPSSRAEAETVHPCSACDVRTRSVCGALDLPELRQLAAILATVSFRANQTIVAEGDPAQYLFNVTEGAVKLFKLLPDGRRQVTGFLFPGDFLGIALNDTYAYGAEALGPVELCRFPRQRLERLIEATPHLEKRLLAMAANELVAAQDQMMLLGRKSAREKVASFLLNLSERAEQRGQAPDPVALPMGRTDIADYLGLTTETVSRTFTQLKTQQIVTLLEGGAVRLTDRIRLEAIAAGDAPAR